MYSSNYYHKKSQRVLIEEKNKKSQGKYCRLEVFPCGKLKLCNYRSDRGERFCEPSFADSIKDFGFGSKESTLEDIRSSISKEEGCFHEIKYKRKFYVKYEQIEQYLDEKNIIKLSDLVKTIK